MPSFVHDAPNTLPAIEEIYAIISRDREGKEALCGIRREAGWTAMVTGDKSLLHEMYLPETQRLKDGLAPGGKTIHLMKFSHREELPL